MSPLRRGAIAFGILIVLMVVCVNVTFGVLPNTGSAIALPVITVPGEPYGAVEPGAGIWLTNTLVGTLFADILVLIFVFFAWRSSNGWRKEVPGRFQAWVELLGEFMYNQTKNFAGMNPLSRNWLYPLAATVFVFLLAVNWLKLFPGVESVGIMHCAGHSEPAAGITVSAGYPKLGDRLWVSQTLNRGFPADEDDYHVCEEYHHGEIHEPTEAELAAGADELAAAEEALVEELGAEADIYEAELQLLRLESTEALYEHAPIGLSPDELRGGIVPYLHVVTPYIRGASTDLNLTFGLAIIAFFSFQVFGVAALGPGYFLKFINLTALGNLGKKPMGLIDFGVGVFEIISEFAKMVSLSFRLFGNLFAGGILLMVMSFLIAMFLPIVFYGLELIVTTMQAYVFAVLILVFAGQAMAGHHGDDDHDDH